MSRDPRDQRPETRASPQAPPPRAQKSPASAAQSLVSSPWSLVSSPWSLVSSRWFLVLASATALALRKPWALHTPQLYAEDGSVFLVQDLHLGIEAWWTQYNGYLHLIPRLIAWLARLSADPAWWPALYNGAAFLLSVGVFARLASPRVELPSAAKPWLMLSFALVVGTGEVLINATNVQWLTAFFLILHLFLAPPTSRRQRLGDLALLLLAGLNGPFAIVLAPLFLFRVVQGARSPQRAALDPRLILSHSNRPALAAFLAVAFCATVQIAVFLHHGASLLIEANPTPFRPVAYLALLGSRLVTWPLFGPTAARFWPAWIHLLGLAALVSFFVYSLRHDTPTRTRLILVTIFLLLTLAGTYRGRADTFPLDTLTLGDRYFYIPRVIVAWLLILAFRDRHRGVAWTARALAVLSIVIHTATFQIPAPPDYGWAENCDPIRRAEPANINTLPEGWFIEFPGGLRKP